MDTVCQALNGLQVQVCGMGHVAGTVHKASCIRRLASAATPSQ